MPGQQKVHINGNNGSVETDLLLGLTQRLESLRIEKEHLERVLEQESIPKLHRQLSLLLQEQQKPQPTTASSPSAPSSPLLSTSPLLQYSSSSPTFSTAILSTSATSDSADPFSAALINALKSENNELRRESQRQARVARIQQLELIELRRRCGISVEELELEEEGGDAGTPSGYPGGDSAPGRSRTRGEISGSGAMHIPGASMHSGSTSSVSPRDRVSYNGGGAGRRRRSSSSLTTSTRASTTGSSSSLATNVTTPSSSYPTPQVPHPTPIGSYASPPPTQQHNSFRNFAPNFLPLGTTQYHNGQGQGNTMALNEEDLLPSPPFSSSSNGGFSRNAEEDSTPLSISPGSRSGSLSRRASLTPGGTNSID